MVSISKFIVGSDDAKREYDKKYIFYVLKTDIYIHKILSRGIFFEKKLVMAIYDFLKNDDVFIDIGCNIGNLSIPISRKLTNGFVYGFEPQSMMYKILKKNIEANVCDNIKIFKYAVGHKNKTVELSNKIADGPNTHTNIDYDSNLEFNYSGLSLGEGGESVDMIKLDSFKFDENYIKRLKVIKVDVEGAEPMVFYGARELIKKYKPVIIFEQNFKMIPIKVKQQVYEFSILEFCYDLGYNKIFQLPVDNFILTHPSHKKYSKNIDYKKTNDISKFIQNTKGVYKYEFFSKV